ncbi:hypothetical protein D1AOALGA4SA_8092 [Olavius algarvensis Delta 1 endosymbiont]|nr:hypothetical protein D1AOALGA4SA_8092 [Olavius algarvensis Delta 1 endosymbiont]
MDHTEDEQALAKMQALYAKLYFHMAAEYCRTFEPDGEAALRQAIRDFGTDRGRANRAEHEKHGYPIHLKTLFTIGGFPGKAGFKRNLIDLKPEQRISETLQCPLCDVWRKMDGLNEGIAYCEEIHSAMWSAYDPDIETNQPKIMTRGDDLCRFDVFMPAAKGMPEADEYPQVDFEVHLQNLMDLQAKLYYYLARGLLHFGVEGEAAVRRAIRRFGRERGLELRKQHLAQGLEINMHNLFTHYDLPGDARFSRNKIELTEQTRLSETLECTFFNVWQDYPDGNSIGRIYCEEVHHEIFGAYDEAVQTNLSQTLTQGDDRCRFSIYFRPANTIPQPDWAVAYEKNMTGDM